MTFFRRAVARSLCGAVLLSAVASTALAQQPGEPVTLNFVGADIEGVARTMGLITGRTMVVDPRVKGTINLSSDRPQSPAAAYDQFLAALRLQGYTVVESSGISKVVPEAEGKLQAGVVTIEPGSAGANQIVTRVFQLVHETANNLVPVLRPLISPNNTINVNPGSNSLVITDYADNLARLGRIIAALDLPNATDVEVLPLKHALATDMAVLIVRLTQTATTTTAGQGQVDNSFRTVVIAEPRSNALIVRAANPARVLLIKSLVQRLDQPSSKDAAGNIHVVYLKNADAVKLATTLRAALAGLPTGASPATGPPATAAAAAAAAAQASAQPSTGGQIQADPATNALIITAPEPQYRQLRAVIDQLDARRAQVFVESLIAEVNADKVAEFGIQWQGLLGNKGDNNIGFAGTNFGILGNNIIRLATAPLGSILPGSGLNLAAANQTNGIYVLGFLARFLQTTGDGNILSTPNLLTLDNEEAKIVIGQNVPFVTGSFTNAGAGAGNGSVNPFQTIERKDVGLTLRVKPQISENGTIRLTIFQEVSSVQASTLNNPNGPTTNKRSIESNVLVDDGAIVVLGGLLQDEYSGSREQVPVVGDVPLFGNLFRTENRSRKKTNLMVFLRPVVVRDAAATDTLSMDRYEQMRNGQTEQQPLASPVLNINSAPLLPVPPASRAQPAPAQKPPAQTN